MKVIYDKQTSLEALVLEILNDWLESKDLCI